MIGLKLFGASAVLVAHPAVASEWWYVGSVGKTSERIAYFADADPAGGDARYRRLWVSRLLEKPGARGETSVTSIFTFDCSEKRVSEMQQMLANVAGDEIKTPATLPSWSFVPPDSMAAKLLGFRCDEWRPPNGKLVGSPSREIAEQRAFQ